MASFKAMPYNSGVVRGANEAALRILVCLTALAMAVLERLG